MSKPYMCPVCLGRGKVEGGFYRSNMGGPWSTSGGDLAMETCRTCKGEGIVWPKEK